MKTIKIELKNTDNSQLLEVLPQSLEKDFIEVAPIVAQDITPYFLELPTQKLVTLLDFTGVIPYEIWYFDIKKKFKGKGFSSLSRHGNFRIQTQAKYMLLVKHKGRYSEKLREFQCEIFQFVEE